MRTILVVLTAVLMLASPTVAQETRESVSHATTVFGSLGGIGDGTATIHFGGGEELIWPNGLGLGADIGYITSTTAFADGLGLLTAGPIYEFRTNSRYKPFVRGGVSLAFRNGALPLVHVGGGVNRWFDDRWGLKLEVRDHFDPRYPSFQVLEFSVGLLFKNGKVSGTQ